MKSVTPLCIAIYVICMPMVIHSFSTTRTCVDDVFNSVKDQRSDLATEYLFSNEQAKETLRDICSYYLNHKVNRVLQLVDRETCPSYIPTTSDLTATIDKGYIQLLDFLKKFEGQEIPISFNSLNEIVRTVAKSYFNRTRDRLAIACLRIHPDKIA